MTPTDEAIAPHMARFIDMLDAAFGQYGVAEGLPARFRDAVMATPRHCFVHRFRSGGGPGQGGGPLRDNDAEPLANLAEIYSDAVMAHVDAAGERLPSTNSQPSYVLWLLDMLDLRPGDRVLEIGSGSGWLAAVMGRLVGDSGRVTGIEIFADLAERSRADLARLGIGNVSIVTGDAAAGDAAGAPFDRVMITAASWDLPTVLFDQVAAGGRVLAPVELRGGGCQVSVLQREGDGFVARRSTAGFFVPLLGVGQQRPRLRQTLAEVPFWGEIADGPTIRAKLPLATGPGGASGSAVAAFRAFLGRTEPGFAIFADGAAADPRPWLPAERFGVTADRSVAFWEGGTVIGYGGPGALRALLHAYAAWAAAGLPGLAGFGLRVVRAGDLRAGGGPAEARGAWVEARGATALVWRLPDGAEAWRAWVEGGDADA